MKRFETTKLFYDEYKYKVVILNALGHIFRQKNLSKARTILDSLQRQYDQGEDLELHTGYRVLPITSDLFLENKRLYREFAKMYRDRYRIRIESSLMTIYSNDKLWIETVRRIAESPIETWAPRKECEVDLERETNIILTRHPNNFEYKISLSSIAPVDPNLAKWIRANPDKANATELCLAVIERKEYPRGQYFYVRDEKILQLVTFMIDRIGRIDKLVYVEGEDK